MKRIKVYTIGILGNLFCKIVKKEKGYVMQKRGISMLIITPIMLPIYFLFHGIYCLAEWIDFATTYRCQYIIPRDHTDKLTLKRKITYTHYFITNY